MLMNRRIYGLSSLEQKLSAKRVKEYPVRIVLPLDQRMADRIAVALQDDEPRVSLIRKSIERELKRRERQAKKEDKQ